LGQNTHGLSEFAIVKALFPPSDPKASHEERVNAVTLVSRALMALKHQHRAWPVNGLWTITPKGRKTHG
jgi:hypothetical protein